MESWAQILLSKIWKVLNMEYDIFKGYTIIEGYSFTAVTYPLNVHDAIIIKCEGVSDCASPQYDIPYHTIEEYTAYIQKNDIQKAVIILDDISFISKCPSLKFIKIIPSYQAGESFDFSPLYQMSEIKSFTCQNIYGEREQYLSKINYSKIHGLLDLGVSVNKGTLNYNKIETLKSMSVSSFKGKNHDLTDLFCSKELDTLQLVQCGVYSLNGIEMTDQIQCLYLYYNRLLSDISALSRVKGTLKALRIENCPKIKDFSVLSELTNLELLQLSGNNTLSSLDFLKNMKNLKTFIFSMNVLDGDLSLCMDLSYIYSEKDRKHYNLKDRELPKGKYIRGNEAIEEWRHLE